MRREFCCVVLAAVFVSTGEVLVGGGSVHEAIRYGLLVAIGMFLGLGLRSR